MAKAKKQTPAESSAEPIDNRQRNIFALRGTLEYKAWMDGLAKANHSPLTTAIEQALALLAERIGYTKPPTRC
jgi:hypothetical protein